MKREFNNQSNDYPIVLLPEAIFKFLKTDLSRTELENLLHIVKPQRSALSKPEFPRKYILQEQETSKLTGINGCMVLLVIGVSVMFGFMADNFFQGLLYFIIVLLGESLFFLLFGIELLKFEKKTTSIKIPLKEGEFEKQVEAFNKSKISYESQLTIEEEKFTNAMIKYDSIFLDKTNPVRLKVYHREFPPKIETIRIKNISKRGITELYFLEILNQKLNGNILVDIAPSFKLENEDNMYNPDFTLICDKTSLHIDIEIDEPYTLKDKTPIHYIDCNDEIRNEFFLEHNWCIIRLTEKQIITQPNECVDTIISIYKNIIEMNFFYESNLQLERRWTYEESLIMQNNKYRESYLKN